MEEYLIQFDGNWEIICKLNKMSRSKIEIVTTILPVLLITLTVENIEKIAKIEGVISIDKNCKCNIR